MYQSYWNIEIETRAPNVHRELELGLLRQQFEYVTHTSHYYARKFDKAGVYLDDIQNLQHLSPNRQHIPDQKQFRRTDRKC